MQEFKSPVSRLARLFQKGRDSWKEKALDKQKKIRALEIKVRDLSASREQWKQRALAAESQIKEQNIEAKIVKKKEETETKEANLGENSEELNIKGHSYDVKTIQPALGLLIDCGISLRATEKVFELFDSESKTTPSFSCIRKWLGRIGIYELTRKKEYRDDWIFIIDFTIELGKQKALVVLGVSRQYLIEQVIAQERGLSPEDVELLGLEIMDSTKGEIILSKLDKITERVGVPVQIVADHGSDLARGIKLYQENYPEVIYTHDVTHAMALLLKYRLDADDRYQSFIQKCSICRQRLQQTELSFLSPPAQRSQCRYFNVERLTNWGINLLNSPEETLIKLMPDIEPSLIYPKIIEKLGWLVDYEADLIYWNQMVTMTRSLETQLKQLGINFQSLKYFQENQFEFVNSSLQDFQQQLFDYLTNQCSQIKDKEAFLATSDVIESLLGKYKQFSARCPFKEMGQMLLTICLSTMNLTTGVVKSALEAISFADVKEWLVEVFGQSMLSKRKTLFSANIDDTETA
ncbi:MAG: hypothetical protein ACKPA9_23155 [Microcystis sp.]